MPQTSASGGPGSSAANAAAGSDAPASAVTAAGSGAGDSAVAGSRSPCRAPRGRLPHGRLPHGRLRSGRAHGASSAARPHRRPGHVPGAADGDRGRSRARRGLPAGRVLAPRGGRPGAARDRAVEPGARRLFVVGLVFGLAFFIPLLSWLINLAWYAWAALAVAEAVIFALLAIGQRLMLRLPAWPLAVAGLVGRGRGGPRPVAVSRVPVGPAGPRARPRRPRSRGVDGGGPPLADLPDRADRGHVGPAAAGSPAAGSRSRPPPRSRRWPSRPRGHGRPQPGRAGRCPASDRRGRPRPRSWRPSRATSRAPGRCRTCSGPRP